MKCLFNLSQCPIIKERRRFCDLMDEESERRRESRLDAWGREDFSTYKPVKVLGEAQATTETTEVRIWRENKDSISLDQLIHRFYLYLNWKWKSNIAFSEKVACQWFQRFST